MKQAAVTRKPSLDTDAALNFATGGKVEAKSRARPAPVSGLVPTDDVRLTANIRKDLHLKLKIAAAESRTTIGEIIEALVARHLDKDMPAIVQVIEQAREVEAQA